MLIQNAAHFRVHFLLCFFGNMLRTGHAASQEHFAFVFGIHHHAHFFAHAVTRYHFAGNLRGTFKIVGCTSGNASDKNIFRNAAAEQNRQLAQHLVFIQRNAVALRQLPSQTERTATRHNGNFVDGVGEVQRFRNDSVSGFVVGGGAFFFIGHHHTAAFRPHIDFVFRIFKVAHIDFDFVAAAGK